jgi:sulfur relay (sulfurtransferase) DsrC/TusE family protein
MRLCYYFRLRRNRRAREPGIESNNDRWAAVKFMCAFQEEHQVAPEARFVIRCLTETRGASRKRLFEPFPHACADRASKSAGVKHPRAWITGRAQARRLRRTKAAP